MLAEMPLLQTTLERELAALAFGRRYGKVVEVIGTMLKVAGVQVSLGEVCELRQRDGTLLQRAEVVGFSRTLALLAPFGELVGLSRQTRVIGLGRPWRCRSDRRCWGAFSMDWASRRTARGRLQATIGCRSRRRRRIRCAGA